MTKKRSHTSQTPLDKWVRIIALICAALSLLYYFGLGIFAGFAVSLLFIWLFFALCFVALAFIFPSLRRWWKKRGKLLKILFTICLAAALLLVIVSTSLIVSGFVTDIPESSEVDCLIILGAQVKADRPSLALMRRIDAAYDYLSAHPNTIAIASGGQGADEPISEALCIFNCLVEMGIDPERIILEDQSTSTAENLQFSAELIPDGCESVAIVTNNFHAFRGEATARKALPDIDVYRLPADFHLIMLPHYVIREVAALAVDRKCGDTLRGNLKFGG